MASVGGGGTEVDEFEDTGEDTGAGGDGRARGIALEGRRGRPSEMRCF